MAVADDFRRYLFDPAIVLAAQVFLACVFLGAAVGKLRAWTQFQGVVQNYRLLPAPFALAVAYGLPPLELAVGAALLVPLAAPVAAGAGAAGAALLLLVFAGAMAINIMRGRTDIDCGCFQSAFKQRLSWWLVGRNLIMAAVALDIAYAAAGGAANRVTGVLDTAGALVSGLALFALYTAGNSLNALSPLSSSPHAVKARSGR